jgi:Protein of unknown function (DUF3617)
LREGENTLKTQLLLGTALLAAGVLWTAASWAANQTFDVKPGLWDITTTTEISGMPPVPNLDQMTPEQRARVEGAMKNMTAAPHVNKTKSCVTREGIEKAIAKASSSQNNRCATKISNMTASRVDLHIECTPEKGEMKTNGDITIERQDPEHIKGNGGMKVGGVNGRTMNVKWSMTGAFISSDCGNVKPDDQ